MATGIETAGLILAAFPLVITALEHYENGFQVIREWVRFKGEFAAFLNALIRQRIFFRQNIEELLGPIVASEYEMSVLLDNPGGEAWADESLNAGLRQRLPGKYEYESYATTVSYILETLHKLMAKLKIAEGRPLWVGQAFSSGRLRLEYEMKRIMYTLNRKTRDKLMSRLERHNNEIQTLLGNSERLEPMRKKRRSPITRYFHQIRDQVHNLHAALIHAWRCDDSPTHTAKLLLEKRVRSDKDGGHQIEDPASIKFNMVFAHLGERSSDPSATRTSSDWCAAKIEPLDIQPKYESLLKGLRLARWFDKIELQILLDIPNNWLIPDWADNEAGEQLLCSMQIQDWQATAKAKVADIHSSIPKEWRLSDMDLDKAGQQRTLSGPFIEQYLTDEEKDIIRHDSIQIVGKIKSRDYTAVDVTRAYCKTAAVAQQIVSHDISCGASSINAANSSQNNCLHEIMFDFAFQTAKDLDDYYSKNGSVKGPLHGLPISLKDQFHVKGYDTTMGYVGWIGTYEGIRDPAKVHKINSQLVEELLSLGAVLYCK
ncbi:MAG: hypothetical protein Q9205_006081, partial [Flavoplaca limonia]